MFIKLIILFYSVYILSPPINSIVDLFTIILILFSFSLLKNLSIFQIFKNIYILITLIIILILNFLIPKNFYDEAHQVFVNKKDLKIIQNFIPEDIFEDISYDFENNYDFERSYNSHSLGRDFVENNNFINSEYAFSSDNIFKRSSYSRKTNRINFSSREDLRIGQINTLNYNLANDKYFRRSLPYYVFFEIPNIAHNSKICGKGKFYYKFENNRINNYDIKNLKFIKKNNKQCINFQSSNNYLYIFGYSINLDDDLEIKLYESNKLLIYKYYKNIVLLILLILIVYFYHDRKNYFNCLIFSISSFATIVLFLIRDINIITGLRYYRGGADGLLHFSYGREIAQNLSNYNFYDALKGSENIYYFMPGLRYFSSFNNYIFGDSSYGYVIICIFIPIIIFRIFNELITRKVALILFTSFIFIPVFENMGFGYFNYVWQAARYHAESLSIFLILVSFYLIIKIHQKKEVIIMNLLISILLSLAVFLRPNFLPTSLIFFVYLIILLFQNHYFNQIFFSFLGYSLIFICLVHNVYFGKEFVFFTNAAVNFKLTIYMLFDALRSLFIFDIQNENLNILKNQFFDWNPVYNIHRLIIILFIFYRLLLNKYESYVYVLFISMLSQHGVLFLTHASSRYAYLAWLLTFILFVYLISKMNFWKNRYAI